MLSIQREWIHDLRAVAQTIASSAELLRLTLRGADPRAMEYLDMLQKSVSQLRRMLSASLTQAAEPSPSEADLPAVVNELCQRCQPMANARGIALHTSGNVEALSMRLDEDLLSRVLLNLISNALRFTPDGGRVDVVWQASNDALEISVRDTGCGIAHERLPWIFLSGETEGGNGYGLPSALRCARSLGGTLTAESEVGKGSVFTLHLPTEAGHHHCYSQ